MLILHQLHTFIDTSLVYFIPLTSEKGEKENLKTNREREREITNIAKVGFEKIGKNNGINS